MVTVNLRNTVAIVPRTSAKMLHIIDQAPLAKNKHAVSLTGSQYK